MHHLHALGIIHRDFRASNILVASIQPLCVVVSDFGVSHRLRKYTESSSEVELGTAEGAGTDDHTVVRGDAALGPIAWMAPEVVDGSADSGVTVTPASDVYMLGGLMFEVLTCGRTPFYWLDQSILKHVRRAPAGIQPVGYPAAFVGLHGMSVLDAAAFVRLDIPWRVGPDASRSSLIALMKRCLDSDPTVRPTLDDVQIALLAVPH